MTLQAFRPSFGEPSENSRYALTSWLFLRGLALIYLAAFASMATQIEGLIGVDGILPLTNLLEEITRNYPEKKYLQWPMLFWVDPSDPLLIAVCYAGIGAALLLFLNKLAKTALILCYVLYLSIAVAGQDFTAFQWDALLLETGFLAILLPWGSPLIIFLYRFLIARFMFMSGIVKLASGDPSWTNLTALDFHYLTQPLPSPLAYYAYNYLPQGFNKLCVAGIFVIELIIPFFVFLPRRYRHFAAWSFIVLQSSIMLTGNYNFFNLLTILLCVFLFDDKDLVGRFPSSWVSAVLRNARKPGRGANALTTIWLMLVMTTCATHIWLYHSKQPAPALFGSLIKWTSAFWVVNNYGPFSIMTTERPEIIVQGSRDGQHWSTYKFNYKPVDLDKHLSWNIPHQPRLDWQMWFAALSTPAPPPWFAGFMTRLLTGSPQVLALLADNPFPKDPPVQVRALLYRYSYTTPEQRAIDGDIWRREYLRVYWPPSKLNETTLP